MIAVNHYLAPHREKWKIMQMVQVEGHVLSGIMSSEEPGQEVI